MNIVTGSHQSLARIWMRLAGLQVVAGGFSLVASILAAVAVPPAVFGAYSLMLSAVQMTYGVCFSWLNHVLLRFGREEFSLNGSVGAVLVPAMVGHGCVLIVVTALFFVAFGVQPAWLSSDPGARYWFAVGLGGLVIFEALAYATQASGRFQIYGISQVATKAGPLFAVCCYPWVPGSGASFLLSGAIVGWLLAAAISGLSVTWKTERYRAIGSMLAYGWRLPFASAAGVLSNWLGVWFVGTYLGIYQAGIFAWANALFGLATSLLVTLSAVLAPIMVDVRRSGDVEAIHRHVRATLSVALLMCAVAPIGFLTLRLCGLVVPETHVDAMPLLVVLCGALPAQLVCYAINPLLMAHERLVGKIVAGNVAIAIVMTAANAVMVPHLGMLGAALATSIAFWFAGCVWMMLARTLSPDLSDVLRVWILVAVPFLWVVVAMASLALTAVLVAGVLATWAFLALGRHLGCFDGLGALLSGSLPRLTPVDRAIRWFFKCPA